MEKVARVMIDKFEQRFEVAKCVALSTLLVSKCYIFCSHKTLSLLIFLGDKEKEDLNALLK